MIYRISTIFSVRMTTLEAIETGYLVIITGKILDIPSDFDFICFELDFCNSSEFQAIAFIMSTKTTVVLILSKGKKSPVDDCLIRKKMSLILESSYR